MANPPVANSLDRHRVQMIPPGSTLTAQDLYEEYCTWCAAQQTAPLALPTFGREFGELGVQKAKVSGRVRYIGIALRSDRRDWADTRDPVTNAKVA